LADLVRGPAGGEEDGGSGDAAAVERDKEEFDGVWFAIQSGGDSSGILGRFRTDVGDRGDLFHAVGDGGVGLDLGEKCLNEWCGEPCCGEIRDAVGNRSGEAFDRLLEVRVRGVGGEERVDFVGGDVGEDRV